jgi:hypothetical protein
MARKQLSRCRQREPLVRWMRSVTHAAPSPQPAMVLAFTIHLSSIVLPYFLPAMPGALSNSERGCDVTTSAGVKTSQVNRRDGVLALAQASPASTASLPYHPMLLWKAQPIQLNRIFVPPDRARASPRRPDQRVPQRASERETPGQRHEWVWHSTTIIADPESKRLVPDVPRDPTARSALCAHRAFPCARIQVSIKMFNCSGVVQPAAVH